MRLEEQLLELDVVKEEIVKYACFSLGKQRIRQCSYQNDYLYIQREYERCKEALGYVYHYGSLPFGNIQDISKAVNDAMRNRCLSERELKDIENVIYSIEAMSSAFKKSEVKKDALNELFSAFSHELALGSEIKRCISPQCEVYDNASSTLKHLKKQMRDVEGNISKVAQSFVSANANLLMDSITTKRGNRTCVLVKISEKNKIDGMIHGESASKQSAYIEPKALIVLNNQLESLHLAYQEEIARILYELSQKVKGCSYALLANIETLGILDELFAKAMWGKAHNACMGEVVKDKKSFCFKNARHPLIDPNKVVANTYQLYPPYTSLMITGSNTGGKSVALKTIGLFSAMALCAIPLPCDEAIVPYYDDIYISIGDEQSIQESLSTFSASISKLANILKQATPNSLVLLDELGNGTDPKEGEAIALAALEAFEKIKCTLITTTHFQGLKSYGATSNSILLASVEFDVEKLCPTYRYHEGMSQGSHAFSIASRYGLSDELIVRAKQIKDEAMSEEAKQLEKLEVLTQELKQKEMMIDEVLLNNKKLEEQLIKKQKQLERNKENLLAKLEEQQRQAMNEKMREAQVIIDKLKALKPEAKPHEHIALKQELEQLTIIEEEDSDEEFKVNDQVKIKSMNYYGVIIELKKDKATILCNGMKMKAKLSDLTHSEVPKEQKAKQDRKIKKDIEVKSFPIECNLIGMRVEEAKVVLNKYLDNALYNKVYQVRIIHGFGTGRLRKGVHELLAHHSLVESYEYAPSHLGGLGATVVKLKHKGK